MATKEEIENAVKLRLEYEKLKTASDTLTDAEKERLKELGKIFQSQEKTLENINKQISGFIS